MNAHASPPDPRAYDAQVWEVVRKVPKGRVTTYGTVARLVPRPEGVDEGTYRAFGARWVGGAMARCPDDVPWHRVVNARGEASPRAGGGHWEQWELLRGEGVEPRSDGRLDLDLVGWPDPPGGRAAKEARPGEDAPAENPPSGGRAAAETPPGPVQGSLF